MAVERESIKGQFCNCWHKGFELKGAYIPLKGNYIPELICFKCEKPINIYISSERFKKLQKLKKEMFAVLTDNQESEVR